MKRTVRRNTKHTSHTKVLKQVLNLLSIYSGRSVKCKQILHFPLWTSLHFHFLESRHLPRARPAVPDDGHVVHAGLVAVCQLLEAHLRLPVHRVTALGLNLPLSLWQEINSSIEILFSCPVCDKIGLSSTTANNFSYMSGNLIILIPFLCLSLGSKSRTAIPLATCSPTWVKP